MTNNDIIRRLRYTFNYNDSKMIELFKLADYVVQTADIHGWLRKMEDPLLIPISDRELAMFLNGLIIDKRGKRDGPQPEPETQLTNNMILRKLKIAMDIQSDGMLEMCASIDKPLGKHELSAFFRNARHRSYRPCLDQYLRNFLNALQAKHK